MITVDKKILIVGAGPVGLSMACLLKKQGIHVDIIEKHSSSTKYSKAIGIHSRTLESMSAIGLSKEMVKAGRPLHNFKIHQNNETIIDTSFVNNGSKFNFVLGLPQSVTEKLLINKLTELGGQVQWENELIDIECIGNEENKVKLKIKSPNGVKDCKYDWVIGADGSRSSVREYAGIKFEGSSYGKGFILGDVKVDCDFDNNTLQFFLSEKGYLLFIPMPNGMHRIIAQTDKKYEDFQLSTQSNVSLKDLQSVIDTICTKNKISVHSPEWITEAPFYHRQAETAIKGNIVLVGDSFHLFSPLGAQGLNTGFQDAFNLSWKLASVLKGYADRELINTYKYERESIAKKIAEITSITTEYITSINPAHMVLRQAGSKLLNNDVFIQDKLPMMMSGLLQNYENSILSLNNTGSRFPDSVIIYDSAELNITELLHQNNFSLVIYLTNKGFENDEINVIKTLISKYSNKLNVFIVVREEKYIKEAKEIENAVVLEDDYGSFQLSIGNPSGNKYYLVRPDGYLCLESDVIRLKMVTGYFDLLKSLPTNNGLGEVA